MTKVEEEVTIAELKKENEELKKRIEKLNREIFGLKQSNKNFREKQEKYFHSLTYDNDIIHRDR